MFFYSEVMMVVGVVWLNQFLICTSAKPTIPLPLKFHVIQGTYVPISFSKKSNLVQLN